MKHASFTIFGRIAKFRDNFNMANHFLVKINLYVAQPQVI